MRGSRPACNNSERPTVVRGTQPAAAHGRQTGGSADPQPMRKHAVYLWKKYCAWDGAQPFETVLRTKNGEWVQTQGLNSLTQPAAYYRLTGD